VKVVKVANRCSKVKKGNWRLSGGIY